MKLRTAVVIRASRAEVWNAVEDVTSHTAWMRDAEAIRITSPHTRGRGVTFDCDTRVGPLRTTDRMRITEWAPRRAMGVAHVGLVRGEGRFTLRRTLRGGTRFVWEEELQFPRWMGGPFAALAARPVLKWVWRGNLRRLKELVESAQPRS